MDPRDREATFGKWYDNFDEDKMCFVITVRDDDSKKRETGKLDEDGEAIYEEIRVSAKYEVCGLCGGQGRHVNPSIDYNGLTSEDFRDDPDFEDMYFGGGFDVECYRCNGKRVEPVVYWEVLSREVSKLVSDIIKDFNEDVRERESEMRMEYGGYY